jgi:hypothetical protein
MMPVDDNAIARANTAAEITRIFTHASLTAPLPSEDVRHIGQIVAARSGLSQRDAETRVMDTYARLQANVADAEAATKTALEVTREAVAYGTLWLFLSLLIGAFVASLSATFGGHMRDD